MPQSYVYAMVPRLLHYYPFGSVMQTRSYAAREGRFGFNGQEKELELGDAYAFEFRIYDARQGRFFSVDPLAMDYAWNSVYSFAENRVILMIDLEGKEAYYPNPVNELWKSTGITQSSADQICRDVEQTVKTIAKYSGPALVIVGGVLTIGVVAVVGTASLTFTIVGTLSGSMAVAGGLAQEAVVIAGREDLVDKIPTSYFGGMALSVELMVGTDNRTFSGAVSFVEGIYTWQPTDLKAFETGLTAAGYSADAINAIKGGFELGPDLSTSIQSAINKYNTPSTVTGGGSTTGGLKVALQEQSLEQVQSLVLRTRQPMQPYQIHFWVKLRYLSRYLVMQSQNSFSLLKLPLNLQSVW